MDSKEIVSDMEIDKHLNELGFTDCVDEGRLMLVELLLKAGAGYYNSHTEEHFLRRFGLLKGDRTPNKKGRRYLCSMVYMHSNRRPECFNLMEAHRISWDKAKPGSDETAITLYDKGKIIDILNPRLWTEKMHRAWHQALPDVQAAFEALRKVGGMG